MFRNYDRIALGQEVTVGPWLDARSTIRKSSLAKKRISATSTGSAGASPPRRVCLQKSADSDCGKRPSGRISTEKHWPTQASEICARHRSYPQRSAIRAGEGPRTCHQVSAHGQSRPCNESRTVGDPRFPARAPASSATSHDAEQLGLSLFHWCLGRCGDRSGRAPPAELQRGFCAAEDCFWGSSCAGLDGGLGVG